MEALAIFGVACNVVQVVDFSLKVADTCKEIAEKGTTSRLDDYEKISQQLEGLSLDLERSINDAPQPVTKDDSSLLAVSEEVSRTARDVRIKLQEVLTKDERQRGRFSKMRKLITCNKSLEELYENLRRQEDVLNTRLLVELSHRQDDIRAIQKHVLEKVDMKLHDFVDSLSRGITSVTALLQASREQSKLEHNVTLQAIRDEGAMTRAFLGTPIRPTDCVTGSQYHDHLLKCFYYPEIWLRQDSISQVSEDTCEWIFGRQGEVNLDNGNDYAVPWDSFTTWLQDSAPLYWIRGKAGSGKSTLMKFISQDIRTRHILDLGQSTQASILRAFFWKAGSPSQRSIRGLLRSLLYQICESDVVNVTERILQYDPELRYRTPGADWSEQHLMRLASTCLSQSRRSMCIFIDGLDEYEEEAGGLGLSELVDFVKKLASQPNVKICVSSRPETQLKFEFNGEPQLNLEDLTRKDINRFVMEKLTHQTSLLHIPERELKRLADLVTDRADGVFFWVVLVVKSLLRGLNNQDTVEELNQRLSRLPTGLDALFATMWSRLGEDESIYAKEAATLFRIVMKFTDLTGHAGPSVFDLVLASTPRLADTVLTQESLCSLWPIWQACTRLIERIPVICGGLLEVKATSTRTRECQRLHRRHRAYLGRTSSSTTNAKSSTLLDFLIQGEDIFAKEQRKSWKNLAALHHTTTVSFLHRSVKDFFEDNPTGQSILQQDYSSITELFSNVLKSFFVTWTLRFSACTYQVIGELLQGRTLHVVQDHSSVIGHGRGSVPDYIHIIHENIQRMLHREHDHNSKGTDDWFLAQGYDSEECFRKLPYFRDFLGFVAHSHPPALRFSEWATVVMQEGGKDYMNYLLACADPRRLWYLRDYTVLFQQGADPNNGFNLNDNTQSEESAWSLLLHGICVFLEDPIWYHPAQIQEAETQITLFLRYGADTKEAVIQTFHPEQWDGPIAFDYLHVGPWPGPQTCLIRSTTAMQLVRSLRESKNSGPCPSTISWRYVIYITGKGFTRVHMRHDSGRDKVGIAGGIVNAMYEFHPDIPEVYYVEMLEDIESQLQNDGVKLIPISGEEALEYLGLKENRSLEYQKRFLESFQGPAETGAYMGTMDTDMEEAMEDEMEEELAIEWYHKAVDTGFTEEEATQI